MNRFLHFYSGGTKRKIGTAVALLGNPQILLLDEPTTGLDPVSKRRVWNLISMIRESGKTIILTSNRSDVICVRIYSLNKAVEKYAFNHGCGYLYFLAWKNVKLYVPESQSW